MSADRLELLSEESGKVFSTEAVAAFVSEAKKEGRTVGLITGCFDILHLGHIKLFREAKKRVDLLVVGLDMDETLIVSKGIGHPVNNLSKRAEVLSELNSVDLIFPIEFVVQYGLREKNDLLFIELYKRINPTCLVTDITTDDYWVEKQNRAKKIGIDFIALELPRLGSSTQIAQKIEKEF